MKTITKLTPAQEARFPEFVQKWIAIGLSTAPADRERAERAIAGLYSLAKLKEPLVIWLPCPISAALSAVCYTALIQHRLVEGRKDVSKNSAVYSPIGSAIRSAVHSEVRSSVDNAIDIAVHSEVGRAVGDVVGRAVGDVVGSAVDGAISRAVSSAVSGAVSSSVNKSVLGEVGIKVDRAVDTSVRGSVSGVVRSLVDNAIGIKVDSAVRSSIGDAVDSAVRSAVGNAVDKSVLSAVGIKVDGAVRIAVYSAVGDSVDSAVRSAVGNAVDITGRSFFGGALWNAGYSSWADYFNEVCGIAIDRNFLEMAESCGFYWTLDGACFASERPSEIHLDEAGRLHCETGMSIRYTGTGWGLFHWHGTQVPGEWILDRTKLTPQLALKETNIERRRAACEMLGWSSILRELNAKTIDRDNDPQIGELVEVNLPDLREPAKFLIVKCGTGREFAVGIPPQISKALDAQAWMIGLEPSDFVCPEIRT